MTTINTVSVCSRCGAINKSGERSCCGRGGSWFKNCGGADNTKLHHTWHEGIQVCKARSQTKTDIVGGETFIFTSVNTSTPMSDTTSIVTTAYTSDSVQIITHGCVNLLNVTVHIYLLFISVF